MQVQVNTDHNVEGHEVLAGHISGVVKSALNSLSDHITRVEVHLTDESGHNDTQNDKRCMMEARLEGRQPIAVTHHATTLHEAVGGAADKMTRLDWSKARSGGCGINGAERVTSTPRNPETRWSDERHVCERAAKEKCHGNIDETVQPLMCGNEQSLRNAMCILAIHTQ